MNKETPQTSAQPGRLHLPITAGAELLIEIIDLKLRIKSVLIGMEHEGYIIVKIFPNDLIGTFRSDAVKDSPMVIRYLHKGTVYAFKAKVLTVISAPAKLFIVSYPDGFEEIKVLDTARFECILPASAMVGNDIVDMTVVDVSKEGCLCMIKASGAKNEALSKLLQINKRLELMVQFPGLPGKFDLVGRIRNLSKGTDRIMLGVLFESMSDDARSKLDHLISLTHGTRKQ